MVRSELSDILSEDNPDLPEQLIEQALTTFFAEIMSRLASGGRVELRGFGSFSTRHRIERTGRNPRNGEAVEIASMDVIHFRAGKELCARINAD